MWLSQFNYSRNITFDIYFCFAFANFFTVAIQLFAEYNFWYKIIKEREKKKEVAIQLFAEYNFWFLLVD